MRQKLLAGENELLMELRAIPGLSGKEDSTRQCLKDFLTANTSVEIFNTEQGLFAVYNEGAAETICLRADLDAILNSQGVPYHGCGHDGHSASLAGAAARLDQRARNGEWPGVNVVFLWQPAEENGKGALQALPALKRWNFKAVYGCHNIPGYPLGTVLLRKGVFAIASSGVTITLEGRQSHAAYPEDGINPGYLIGNILEALPALSSSEAFSGRVLVSVVEIRAGSHNFGISAGDGRLSLTFRAEQYEDLKRFRKILEDFVLKNAKSRGVKARFAYTDEFPDTASDPVVLEALRETLRKASIPCMELKEAMRWSEDFGWYMKEWPGAYFGIGSGERTPGLHTDDYAYPEELLIAQTRVWETVIYG